MIALSTSGVLVRRIRAARAPSAGSSADRRRLHHHPAGADLLGRFRDAAGDGKPAQAGYKVCYAESEDEGAEIAHRIWANSGLPGELAQVLPSPRHFEQASQLVTVESTRESVACGKDPKAHIEALRPYADAGFGEIYVANVGPHYKPMLEFYRDEILPAVRS